MFRYIIMHLKSQMEYKASFILSSIAQLAAFGTYCVIFYSLFDRFGLVKDYNIYQIMLTFGIIQFGQSFSECLLRGFDQFSNIVKNGNFDLLLIRPQNIFLQIMGTKIEFSKLIKSIFGLAITVYAIIKLGIYLEIDKMLIIVLMLIGSAALFSAILIIGAAFCFVTIEGLEVISIFIYGTRDFAQYPLDVFNDTVRIMFTYIIPIAFATFLPLLYIIGRTDNILYALAPFVSILTLVPAICLFKLGVRKYKSSGS